ncbi:MAG: HAD family hydrolase [Lachnospiraceae bacterium]|jgi:phosphoglycolate phosphatase|nr:HAD family hydrolase [Lachnospiraceae bacterium]
MKKAVIFDVDGTLWDAVSVITQSWNLTAQKFPEVRSVITEEKMRSMMGKTMDEFVCLFPEVEPTRAKEILERCSEEEITFLQTHPGTLYPGITEVIKELSEQYELYIVSNCQEGYIEALLSACNLTSYFNGFENYGRTGKGKGRNIQILMERYEIDKAIYIGDTQMDYEATLEAGVPFLFAAYGMGEAENRRFTANSPSEIPQVITKMRYFSL